MVCVRFLTKFESTKFFELSTPCERTHCKLLENVQIIEIEPSKLKLWPIEDKANVWRPPIQNLPGWNGHNFMHKIIQ